MPRDRLKRLGLWLALLNTANANRLHYHLPTTWIPHTVGNSLGLALPEIVAALDALLAQTGLDSASLDGLRAAARAVTADPPGWANTMAPVTLAYVVSHPQFNIYRGEWADLRVAGFGLDSIPHSWTAFSLTRLVYTSLAALDQHMPPNAALAPLTHWLNRSPVLITALVLAGLTLFYEYGEYRIHQEELAATGGDESKINMMWTMDDTLHDVGANTFGWLVATLLRPSPTPEPAASPLPA